MEENLVRETIDKQNNFKQAGERYRRMNDKEKDAVIGNIVANLWEVDFEI